MFRYIKVTQKGLILVLLPLAFELLFVAILAHQLSATAEQFDKLNFSQRAVYKLYDKSSTILNSTTQLINFQTESVQERSKAADRIISLFKSPRFLGDPDIESSAEMQELFAETEGSRAMVLALAQQMKENANNPVGMMSNKDRDELIGCALTLRTTYDKIKAFAKRLDSGEPEELRRMSNYVLAFLVVGFAISCATSLLVAYVFTFDIVRRLQTISNNAYLLAAGRELPLPEPGTDEIADLNRSLHKTSLLLQASQKKELAILNNAAEVVCSMDRQLRFIAVGASAQKVWGYLPDDLLGRSLLTILTRDTADSVQSDFETALKSLPDSDVTTIVKCKDGTLKDSLWTINWSEESQEFVCVVHDITEQKKIEKLKQAFFSMVSHDLRAPLTSININLANMTSGNFGELPKAAEKLVNNSISSAERLTVLVNDLLDLEKLNSGKIKLDLECISARDVCESAIAALDSMAAGAGVNLIPPAGDAAIMADERRLVQVFTNLISNAIKFSPRNSKIKIEITRQGEFVEIAVTDQGPGIPAQQHAALFEKYSQGSAISNVPMQSTGLGLAIVKSIVTAHGAEVGVVSEAGKGSRFWVRIKEFVD